MNYYVPQNKKRTRTAPLSTLMRIMISNCNYLYIPLLAAYAPHLSSRPSKNVKVNAIATCIITNCRFIAFFCIIFNQEVIEAWKCLRMVEKYSKSNFLCSFQFTSTCYRKHYWEEKYCCCSSGSKWMNLTMTFKSLMNVLKWY